jgi:hypothetical protein
LLSTNLAERIRVSVGGKAWYVDRSISFKLTLRNVSPPPPPPFFLLSTCLVAAHTSWGIKRKTRCENFILDFFGGKFPFAAACPPINPPNHTHHFYSLSLDPDNSDHSSSPANLSASRGGGGEGCEFKSRLIFFAEITRGSKR